MMPRIAILCCLAVLACAADPQEKLQVRLPSTLEAKQLAEALVEHVGVDLQFDPGRLTGTVRLVLPAELTRVQLWDTANRSMLAAGLTTVVNGEPPEYRLVPITEAAAQAEVMLPERLAGLAYRPGFATVVLQLRHLASEAAVKTLATVLSSQVSQVRTLGSEPQRIVLSAPIGLITQTQAILVVLDRPGVAPEVRAFRPLRTAPQALQTAANAAWTASSRVVGRTTPVEFQIAPDGQQLLVVASSEAAAEAVALAERLDQAEPVESRAYRPAHFSLDEVASLLAQVLKDSRQPTAVPEIVRDKLTNRLVITATVAQHERIAAILADIEKTPVSERRRLRSIPIRHRPVEELAKLLSMIMSGQEGPAAPSAPAASAPPATGQIVQLAPTTPGSTAVSTKGSEVSIATDPPTNRLILLGEPQQLEQLVKVIEQLDIRQPQVELEVILATLSSSQNRDLGVDLIGQFSRGETSTTVGSLFGLSEGRGVDRTVPIGASGLSALVLRPGDFAGVIRALETVTGGKSIIRSSTVVVNNAKATVDGVVQQPLTSINSTDTVATTSVSGTTDAGTQITISPQISAADQVMLTYSIEQSSFIGSSTTTPDGAVIPAPKRSDKLASVAIIPDGHVIALGGLSSNTKTTSESRLPWLGSVPVLGWPFRSVSNEDADSRFFVFIRANVLRNAAFADLRRLGIGRAQEMGVDPGWPVVQPQFTP
jgi:type II secretory pathway component GspD/PulD (secretin)